MHSDRAEPQVGRRVVLHFPGFEPLSAGEHHARYRRCLMKTADLWAFRAEVGALKHDGTGSYFDVSSTGDGWKTLSRIYIFDHNDVVRRLNARPLYQRLSSGLASAFRVVLEGGANSYFRYAWRFGLFFLFPFALGSLAIAATLVIAAYPFWLGLAAWHFSPALAMAYIFFFKAFLPWSDRFYVMHLFSDWDMALSAARLDDRELLDFLRRCAERMTVILQQDSDEFVISSHSMGSIVAVHVTGMLLEVRPDLLRGRQVAFVTLGGAVLQCALLRSARVLRARVGQIARTKEMFWLDVQCVTDVISFYKTKTVSACGHQDAPQAEIRVIRIKKMLSPERYRNIKRDMLRVHRQYVLDADRRTAFDFYLLTAGPQPVRSFGPDIHRGADASALDRLVTEEMRTAFPRQALSQED